MKDRFQQIAVLIAVLVIGSLATVPVFAHGPVMSDANASIWYIFPEPEDGGAANYSLMSDAIAGTWYGNMRLSDANGMQRIKMVIPSGCQSGDVCGSLQNFPVQCTWEITYDGYSDGAYEYHFSDSLSGDCPAGSSGSLTLLADGTLYRVHTTPTFTASGLLRQRPNAGN
jgi:hypothetical protein